MILAIACGAGCAAEPLQDPAGPGGEVRTGTIRTPAGPMQISYEVIDGQAMFQGDIVIAQNQFLDPEVAYSATYTDARTWRAGVIPYVIDAGLPNPQRVHTAIAHWHGRTAVRLIPRTNEPDYVRFVSGAGCSSHVGRIGGVQSIQLHADCSTGNAIHEIGHAAGLWHEQSRADRDAHVTIHYENIGPNQSHNFQKYPEGMDIGAYDIGSIMHYPSWAFSVNGLPTITTLAGGWIDGQDNGLSGGDILGVERLYGSPFPSGRTATLDHNGRIHLFARATDNSIQYIYETSPNGPWSSWQNLGGSAKTAPAVTRYRAGGLEVFYVGGDNALWGRWQNLDGSWSGEYTLGGQLAGRVVATRDRNGVIQLFCRGTNGTIQTTRQDPVTTGWYGWSTIGTAALTLGDPAVGVAADGRLFVFRVGPEGFVWAAGQNADQSWGAWQLVGGVLGGGLLFQGTPAIGHNLDGRLEVFAISSLGRLYRTTQPQPFAPWGSWTDLGVQAAGSPAVGRNSDGRLEAFVINPSGVPGHLYQLGPNSPSWSGWGSLGGSTSTRRTDITRHRDGRLEVFVVGGGNLLYTQGQAPNTANGWSGWAQRPGATLAAD